MRIVKHGEQSPFMPGYVRLHCQCGCVSTFDKNDTDYVQCMTNVCGELHNTTSAHADTLVVKCPECNQRRIIKIKNVPVKLSRSYKCGMILKLAAILNVLGLCDFRVFDADYFGPMASVTIVVSVAIFTMGRFICDRHRERIYHVGLQTKKKI